MRFIIVSVFALGSPRREREGTTTQARNSSMLRAAHLNSIRRMQTFASGERFLEANVELLRTRKEGLERAYTSFEHEHFEICAYHVREGEQEANEQLLADTEEVYFAVKAKLETRINELEPSHAASNQPGPAVVKVRLSDLETDKLPSFDGEYANWPAFKDAFLTDVDDNAELSNVQKLRRLQTAVKGGTAEQALGVWAVRAENYPLAWERLCAVYGDDYRAIQAHIKLLFGVPFSPRVSLTNMRAMANTLASSRRQLFMLSGGEQVADLILLFMMEDRLDPATREAWNMYRSAGTKPTIELFSQFLECKCNSLQGTEPELKRPKLDVVQSQAKPRLSSVPATASRDAGNNPFRRPWACRLCRGEHPLFRCAEFLAMDVSRRNETVVKFQICPNCLKSGHSVNQCQQQRSCPKCPGRQMHNSELCPSVERERAQRRSVLFCGNIEHPGAMTVGETARATRETQMNN